MDFSRFFFNKKRACTVHSSYITNGFAYVWRDSWNMTAIHHGATMCMRPTMTSALHSYDLYSVLTDAGERNIGSRNIEYVVKM